MTMNLLPLFRYSVTPYGYDDENGQNKKFCTIGTQLYLDRNIIRAIRFYHFFSLSSPLSLLLCSCSSICLVKARMRQHAARRTRRSTTKAYCIRSPCHARLASFRSLFTYCSYASVSPLATLCTRIIPA